MLVAAFFAQKNDVISLEGLADFNLESLLDVIPAGIVRDAKDITVSARPCRLKDFMNCAEADIATCPFSDMSAKPSTMTRFPWDCICSRRASKQSILS